MGVTPGLMGHRHSASLFYSSLSTNLIEMLFTARARRLGKIYLGIHTVYVGKILRPKPPTVLDGSPIYRVARRRFEIMDFNPNSLLVLKLTFSTKWRKIIVQISRHVNS